MSETISGLEADRPRGGTVAPGVYFHSTDTDKWYKHDGSRWSRVNNPSAGSDAEAAVESGLYDALGAAAAAQAAAIAAARLTGEIRMIAYAVADAGWLLCDGASVLRSTYAALFAKIGTAYGSADGTHFNVPDLQGRAPYGLGTHSDVNGLGDSDGVATVANRTPNHAHGGVTGAPSATQAASFIGDTGPSETHTHTVAAGNAGFLVVNFQIKT